MVTPVQNADLTDLFNLYLVGGTLQKRNSFWVYKEGGISIFAIYDIWSCVRVW